MIGILIVEEDNREYMDRRVGRLKTRYLDVFYIIFTVMEAAQR